MRKLAESINTLLLKARLEKNAAFYDVSDLEDELGTYFPDELEEKARAIIANQKRKSFGLRHPVIAGIPTLGIWPGISKDNAIDSAVRSLARAHPDLAQAKKELQARRRAEALENAQVRIQAESATQPKQVAAMAIAGLLAHQANKYQNERSV